DLAVLDHRHLAEGVAAQEVRALVRAGPQIDVERLERQAEQRDEQPYPVRVAGNRRTVDLDGRGGTGCGHGVLLDGWGMPRFLFVPPLEVMASPAFDCCVFRFNRPMDRL